MPRFLGMVILSLVAVSQADESLEAIYARTIDQNVYEKMVFLPRRLPGMRVSRLGHTRYVDSGTQVEYLNAVTGTDGLNGNLSYREVRHITTHYADQKSRAGWIYNEADGVSLDELLADNGWRRLSFLKLMGFASKIKNLRLTEDRNIFDTALNDTNVTTETIDPLAIDFFECTEAPCFTVYAQLLAKGMNADQLGTDGFTQAFEAIPPIMPQVRAQMMMGLIFKIDDEREPGPIGTASLFVRDGVAGIYELILLPDYNTPEILRFVVRSLYVMAVESYAAKVAVLVRPEHEADIWIDDLNFKNYTRYKVWAYPGRIVKTEEAPDHEYEL